MDKKKLPNDEFVPTAEDNQDSYFEGDLDQNHAFQAFLAKLLLNRSLMMNKYETPLFYGKNTSGE
jgi:hypothetical protein